jgi:hypothetical protein
VTVRTYDKQRRWRKNNPLAVWAQSALRSALKRNLITPPSACECCGKPGPLEAHHPDHRDPLRVVWLTRRCHRRLHAKENRLRRRA